MKEMHLLPHGGIASPSSRTPGLCTGLVAGVFACASLVGSLGCATSLGSASGQERVVVAVDAPAAHAQSSSDVQITEAMAPPAPEPPRRRLSQTITLGQGTPEGYAPPPPGPQNSGGPNVVVNN